MIAENHTLGGEQSGHIIMRDFANTGDGALTALHLLQEVATSKKSLRDLAKIMVRYPQVLINVAGVDKAKISTNTVIAAAVTAAEVKLGSSGRVLLRASGTEPLIRVMVEAESETDAQELATSLAALVKSELSL